MSDPPADDAHRLAAQIGDTLKRRRQTVATSESCTAGLVSAALTSVSGASDFFWGGAVVYRAEAKIELAGLNAAFLAAHGTVSAATTEALAVAIRARADTTYGVAVTGWAGPDAPSGETVGDVYGAVASPRRVSSARWRLEGDRAAVRTAAAAAVLELLRDCLAAADDAPDD